MRWRGVPGGGPAIDVGERVAEAIAALCHPMGTPRPSVVTMAALHLATAGDGAALVGAGVRVEAAEADVDLLVRTLYVEHAASLVRMARLFVDDRNAAEDLVQEAFIRLARHAHRIEDGAKSAAYLRSIVLNLARDHNRRGLVSLRHHQSAGREVDVNPSVDDHLVRSEQHQVVLDAVRTLPPRQRDCITLRYFDELGIDAIATTLGLSANSVKTHLKRAMQSLERELGDGR